nr:helix-turn-helix transcriptional regulator [Virgibacillus indicus]
MRAYRREKGLTIAELAERADMNNSHLSQIENGKHAPRLDTFFKIVAILNISDDITKKLIAEKIINIEDIA